MYAGNLSVSRDSDYRLCDLPILFQAVPQTLRHVRHCQVRHTLVFAHWYIIRLVFAHLNIIRKCSQTLMHVLQCCQVRRELVFAHLYII
jgi:hypothetical protein